jgi:hypothetical protein
VPIPQIIPGTQISPAQSDIFTVLGQFFQAVMPAGTKIMQGQANRVPEPKETNYLVMWPTMFNRLATNVRSGTYVSMIGSITGDVLTITSLVSYSGIGVGGIGIMPIGGQDLLIGAAVSGPSVADGTIITGQTGDYTYTVSPAQTLPPGSIMAAGAEIIEQDADAVVQIDVHGPLSLDNAQTISTLFRDPYATTFFATVSDLIVPLYADDPRQTPFINGEQQYENRYTVTAHMQVNQQVAIPMQYMDDVRVAALHAATSYPA